MSAGLGYIGGCLLPFCTATDQLASETSKSAVPSSRCFTRGQSFISRTPALITRLIHCTPTVLNLHLGSSVLATSVSLLSRFFPRLDAPMEPRCPHALRRRSAHVCRTPVWRDRGRERARYSPERMKGGAQG